MKKLAIILFVFIGHTAFAQMDSLKFKLSLDTLTVLTTKLDSVENSVHAKVDSLTQSYYQIADKVQGLTSRFQQKIDSLKNIKLQTEKLTAKIDSLNNVLSQTKQKLETKIESVRQKAIEKIHSVPVPPELQSKVSQLTSSLEKIKLPTLSSEINSPIDFKSLDATLNNLSQSNALTGITDLQSKGIPNVAENMNGLNGITNEVTTPVGSLQQQAGDMVGNAGQVNQLDKLAESQVSQLKEVKSIQEATGEIPSLMPSEEKAKEQIVQQVQLAAVDHFSGKQAILQAAMDNMAKFQEKHEGIRSIADLPKRWFNDLKGKPLIERIVPGIQFQVLGKQGDILVDFNGYVGYRINSKLTSGIGWNQRFAYNNDRHEFNPQARIFGPRNFAEYRLKKGFVPRMEIEAMNTAIPPFTSTGPADIHSREWVVTCYIGMKKEYRFIKTVKGTTTIMLNVYHPHNKNIYSDIINARFGFEFPMKKKVKKSS
ncbi:MAG: hypothetical protein ABI663_19420 [Chryseolinea sp.]